MKNLLLGTTALIAVAGITAEASAAERISLGLRGYHVGGISYSDANCSSRVVDVTHGGAVSNVQGCGDYNEINFGSDSEVHFRGSTTLDNGLKVSFRAELELEDDADVDADADNIDEVYIQFDGGFGRIQFGQNDGVMDQMAVVAPLIFEEHGQIDPDLDPFGPIFGGNPLDTVGDFSGDNTKITYFTPAMNGFQLGLSFTPNPCKNDTGYAGCVYSTFARNYWEVSGTLEHDFDSVSIEFSAGYGQGESGAASEQPSEWTVGANVGFGGFTIGGSYKDSNTSGNSTLDNTSWDFGASYETGPWAFMLAYASGDIDFLSGGSRFDESAEALIGGVTYMYGPGMTIGFGVTTLDIADTEYDGHYRYTDEADGLSVFVENTLSF